MGGKGPRNQAVTIVYLYIVCLYYLLGFGKRNQGKGIIIQLLEFLFLPEFCAAADRTGYFLWVLEADQSWFSQRVDRNDLATFSLCRLQRSHHPWMIRAWILPDDEDRFRKFKIIQRYRSLADADGFSERGTARLVAHIGTIW